jgi:phosphoenolpyruvate synthase/pyruvate phosphate dikinase
MAEKKVKFDYLVGTMIEVPRSVLTADEIAQSAEFFSFGTDDLSQTALGITHAVRARRSCPKQRRETLRARLMPPAK